MVKIDFLTFEDIIHDGNCSEGVLAKCEFVGVYCGDVEELLELFHDNESRIKQAAKLDGYGSGYGDGSGSGYGYGYGYGDGYGYGYGSGDGSGDGYGDGGRQ